MEPIDRKVSLFRPPRTYGKNQPMLAIRRGWDESPSIRDLLAKIRSSETLAEQTDALRSLPFEERTDYKAKTLYGATFSAFYGGAPRRLESEYRPTGCVILDLDHVGGAEAVVEAREAAARVAPDGGLPYTIAAWVSPSGDGLKVAVHMTPMPKTPAEHRAAWATATDLYAAALGIEVDPQTPDVSRVTFLSFDPGILETPRTYGLRWQ